MLRTLAIVLGLAVPTAAHAVVCPVGDPADFQPALDDPT